MYRGGFAQHVLWLASHRNLKGKRFLVEGSAKDMTNTFLFQGDERNSMLEWVTLFCEAPARIQAKTPKGLFAADIGNGIVLLNTKLVKERWGEYADENETIKHSHLLRHIKAIASQSTTLKIRIGDTTIRYWAIDIDRVVLYAETHDIGDVDRIKKFASKDTELTRKVLSSSQYNSNSSE